MALVYLRATAAADGPRRIFLHLLAADGTIVGQADALDVNARSWLAGDLIVQRLFVPGGRDAATAWRLGVYDPQTGRRLLLPDGREALSPGELPRAP